MHQKSKKSNQNEVKEWDIEIGLLRPEEISNKKNSDIEADLEDDNKNMGRRQLTIFDGNGFINNAKLTINMDIKGNEFDTATIGQITKHETCHGIGK